jgi:hypothetical protein
MLNLYCFNINLLFIANQYFKILFDNQTLISNTEFSNPNVSFLVSKKIPNKKPSIFS